MTKRWWICMLFRLSVVFCSFQVVSSVAPVASVLTLGGISSNSFTVDQDSQNGVAIRLKATDADASPFTDLARVSGASISASSYYSDQNVVALPEYLVDVDPTTAWASAVDDIVAPWVEIDFGLDCIVRGFETGAMPFFYNGYYYGTAASFSLQDSATTALWNCTGANTTQLGNGEGYGGFSAGTNGQICSHTQALMTAEFKGAAGIDNVRKVRYVMTAHTPADTACGHSALRILGCPFNDIAGCPGFRIVTSPGYGVLTGLDVSPQLSRSGNSTFWTVDFTYKPNSGYVGPDSFQFIAVDAEATSSLMTVNIRVQQTTTGTTATTALATTSMAGITHSTGTTRPTVTAATSSFVTTGVASTIIGSTGTRTTLAATTTVITTSSSRSSSSSTISSGPAIRPESIESTGESSDQSFPWWVIGTVGGICCLFCLITGGFVLRRKLGYQESIYDDNESAMVGVAFADTVEPEDEDEGVYDTIADFHNCGAGQMTLARAVEIAKEQPYARIPNLQAVEGTYAKIPSNFSSAVTLLDVNEIFLDTSKHVGKGSFGMVYRGQYAGVDIAVKMLHDNFTTAQLKSFYDEVETISRVPEHEFVVGFLGATPDPFMICTEFCGQGSLLGFLRSRATQQMSQAQELKVIKDIAVGMAHLTQYGIIHRDLAARKLS